MSLDADLLIDRRRMRRKLTFWRVVAFCVGIVLIVGTFFGLGGRNMLRENSSHIARITISGLITGDKDTLDVIRKVRQTAGASAAIISINSPGGTTTGSEEIYRALRELAAAKPTVAVVTGTAASGAYIAAMSTDRIISPETAIVGSIGVIMQYPNFSKALDTLGVKVEAIRSSPLKAMPSGVEPTPPEAREALTSTVMDTYDWFKSLVKTRRNLNDEELQLVTNGQVFTGRQALPLKLVDQLGGETEARAWMAANRHISQELRVVDYKPDQSLGRLGFFSITAGIASALGFEQAAVALAGIARQTDVQSLDGLVSVWQPQLQN